MHPLLLLQSQEQFHTILAAQFSGKATFAWLSIIVMDSTARARNTTKCYLGQVLQCL